MSSPIKLRERSKSQMRRIQLFSLGNMGNLQQKMWKLMEMIL